MSALKGHPKGLYLIFATSTAERFSYYGMRAIFILFLTQALLFDKEAAASIYGSYTGLVYLTPLIGGYIADKYWGIRRSVFWGAVMMAVGQFLMFMSASTLDNTNLAHWMMYGGLGFLILGNGCFKPTVSSLVGQLYEPGDRRLDAAYTIFYMGVNVGSFAAPLICGYLGDTGDPHDFKWGFLAAGIMTLFTVVLFETQKNKYLFSPSGEPIGIIPDAKREKKEDKADHISHPKMDKRTKVRNTLVITILTIALIAFFNYAFEGDWVSIGIFTACIVFPVLILLDGSLTKIERSRIFVIYIVAFFVIFFWAAYEQAGASLTLFASGIRRIEAVTGNGVLELMNGFRSTLSEVSAVLKIANPAKLAERCRTLTEELKEKDKQIQKLSQQLAGNQLGDMFKDAKEINGIKIISAMLNGTNQFTA